MSKSYHRNAKKFDDDFEYEDGDTKNYRKLDKFTRQLKQMKLEEFKDHDT